MTRAEEQACVFAPARQPLVPVVGSDCSFPVHRIYCVGQNYAEHAREMGSSGRKPPFFFAKPADAVCTARSVPFPAMTNNLHHEVELVVALGSGGSNVASGEALSLVYGYAVGVDLTRRDLQLVSKERGLPWTTGKGFDHSAPVSAIRPVALCGNIAAASISLAVDGEFRQCGKISQMIWSIPEIISELSRFFELQAGDLVFTGTPAGVGPLQAGDQVVCSVDGVGELAFELGP